MSAKRYLTIGYAAAMAMSAMPPAMADDLASCAAIDDSSARLACYDKLAGRQSPPGVGKWRLDHRHSPTSGGDAVFLTLHAEQADPTALPPWMQPQLVISCDDNETRAMIVPQRRLSVSYQEVDVLLRIDGGDQIRDKWQISANGLSAFRPDPVRWIQGLIDATRLEVGLRPYLDKPIDFTFDVEGLATAIQPLAKACNW